MAVKHFLDTSIVRPLITSPKKIKNFYEVKMPSEKYISNYVKMEYYRGFILSCMEFYGLVSNPSLDGYGDALSLWQNQYKSRAVKAVLAFAGEIQKSLGQGQTAGSFVNNRTFQEIHLANYIKRLYDKIDYQFKNIGTDSDLCTRLNSSLVFNVGDVNNSFINFARYFKNKDHCTKCKMPQFFQRHQKEIAIFLKHKPSQPKNNAFDKIRDELELLTTKKNKLTCTRCSKIGDAIIAILCPSNFSLEYTDQSFELLGSLLQKLHNKQSSELAILALP